MKTIDVFDFDQTLFRSPANTPENLALYEKTLGMPWLIDKVKAEELSKKMGRKVGVRRGWWGRPESLEPPLVPEPAPKEWWIEPVVKEYFQSKNCDESATVILTGRHAGLQRQVLRILHDGGLVKTKKASDGSHCFADPDVQFLCLGMEGPAILDCGPKPTNDTLPWKQWIIKKFAKLFEEAEEINIWEDRIEHAEEFATMTLKQKINLRYVPACT